MSTPCTCHVTVGRAPCLGLRRSPCLEHLLDKEDSMCASPFCAINRCALTCFAHKSDCTYPGSTVCICKLYSALCQLYHAHRQTVPTSAPKSGQFKKFDRLSRISRSAVAVKRRAQCALPEHKGQQRAPPPASSTTRTRPRRTLTAVAAARPLLN